MKILWHRVHEMVDRFDRQLDHYDFMRSLSLKCDTSKPKLAMLMLGSAAAFLVLGLCTSGVRWSAALFCNCTGFAFPAYLSIKAIDSEELAEDHQLLTQWLTYWVIYAFLLTIENFADTLTAWIPFYYAFKLGFLAWLFMPSSNGGAFMYHHYISPFVKTYAAPVDPSLLGAEEAAERAASEAVTASPATAIDGDGGDKKID